MKLRTKMLLSYLVASSMILLMIAVYGGTILKQTLLSDKTEEYNTYTRQLCTSAKLVMADMEQSFFNLYQSVDLADSLKADMAEQTKRLVIEQDLRTMCQNNSYFTSMLAVDQSGAKYYGTSSVIERPEPITALVENRMDELNSAFTLWFADDQGNVYLKKTVSDITPLQFTGLLVAKVESAQLKSTIGLDGNPDGVTGILTKQWNMVLHAGALAQNQIDAVQQTIGDSYLPVSQEITLDGKAYWLTITSDSRYGWHILHLVSLSEMLALSRVITRACLICGIAAAVIAMVLGVMISHSLTRNVKRLLAAMTDVSSGNFEASIDVRGRDEIGELAERFRWMQGRLRETTRQMVQRATEKQQAEYELLELKYRSLQSQISPHFICNILSSINSQALMGRWKEISQLSVSSSQYLRDNMSGVEKKFTSLRAELRYVQEYLDIYRTIYGDGNTLTIDIEESLLDSRVPNMLLQPLVENALVHGGNEMARTISLSARRKDARLILSVTDNGGTISAQVIDAIHKASINPTLTRKMKGFGLRCVLQRLRLLYGDNQHLTIQCDPGRESRIQIDIPWQSYITKETTNRMDFLIGTLTRLDGPGIARVRLLHNQLTCLWTDGSLTDPNWLSLGPNERIYAVSSDYCAAAKGCVNELELTASGLHLLRRQPTGGNAPCYLCISSDGRFLMAANYGSGSLAVFPLGEDGLEPRIQLIEHHGKSIHPTRQTAPHVHQVIALPHLPGFFCAADLGTDQLVVYEQNRQTGVLSQRYRIAVSPGEGPRHLACGPDGSAWLTTELGNNIYHVCFASDHGSLSGGISTLEDANTPSLAAAIRLSANGHHAYVSNRGEDSIAEFSLFPLQKTGVWKSVGNTPRDFVLLDEGRALAACQGEGLTLLQNGQRIASLSLPGSVCVLPLPS